jgi:F1F0 ATPase subunit 2
MNLIMPAAFFGCGLIGGALYFALLRWNTELYLRRARRAPAIALQLIRTGCAAGLLLLVSRHGATALLSSALGVTVARPLALWVLR